MRKKECFQMQCVEEMFLTSITTVFLKVDYDEARFMTYQYAFPNASLKLSFCSVYTFIFIEKSRMESQHPDCDSLPHAHREWLSRTPF